jgi:hypothetical protein
MIRIRDDELSKETAPAGRAGAVWVERRTNNRAMFVIVDRTGSIGPWSIATTFPDFARPDLSLQGVLVLVRTPASLLGAGLVSLQGRLG